MKKKLLMLVTSVVCMIAVIGMGSEVFASSLVGKTVVIDAGHGGHNPGAVANGSVEADNNLAVARLVAERLKEGGADVVMTRTTDRAVASADSSLKEELQARVDLAQKQQGDIFVSIHSNSNENRQVYGAMTFYHDDMSRTLAQAVQKNMVYRTQANDKGIQTAGFYVLRHTAMPSILVEMGFVSNPQEAKLLSSHAYRVKLANGIYEGIEEYFRTR